MTVESRVGDWQCPNPECINHIEFPRFYVYGTKVNCPKCGTGKSAQKPFDWCCPNPQCLNHQNTVYGNKSQCNLCGALRPALNAKGSAVPNEMSFLVGAEVQMYTRIGDWHCPNMSCKNFVENVVYANNKKCPLCGSEKPRPPEGPRPPPRQPPPAPTSAMHVHVHTPNGVAAVEVVPGPGGSTTTRELPAGARPGDWHCPNTTCRNHENNLVYATKNFCPLCGADKPKDAVTPIPVGTPMFHAAGSPAWQQHDPAAAAAMAATMYGTAPGAPGAGQGPSPARPGDWHCPNTSCKNHTANWVFANKSACPLCGTPKPADSVGGPIFPAAQQPAHHHAPPPPPHQHAPPPPPPPRTPHPGAVAAAAAGAQSLDEFISAWGASAPDFGQGGGAAVPGLGAAEGGRGGPGEVRPGDWHCPNTACKNHTGNVVYGSKTSCPLCGTAKPGCEAMAAAGGLSSTPAVAMSRPGDWQCPNTSCKNHINGVYASKSTCSLCGSPNPLLGGASTAGFVDFAAAGARERSRSPRPVWT